MTQTRKGFKRHLAAAVSTLALAFFAAARGSAQSWWDPEPEPVVGVGPSVPQPPVATQTNQAAQAAKRAAQAKEAKPKDEGPEAALRFEKKYREGDPAKAHGHSAPIPFSDLKTVTPLTKAMWSRKDVLSDFKKVKTEEQMGVLVFVKTELCHANAGRLCAVATSAIEKRSTALLKHFKVYGGWVKGNPDQEGKEWKKWEEKVMKEYNFEQGPGMRIVVIIPDKKKTVTRETDAQAMGLYIKEFEKNGGQTPKLEQFLLEAMEAAGDKTGRM